MADVTDFAITNEAKTSTSENQAPGSIALRAQKKILGKMNRKMIKYFVNDTTLRVFDGLYAILKDYYSKAVAEKTVNNMVKIAVKLGAMTHEGQLNADQLRLARDFQKKLHSLTLTIMSFARVDYSYDRNFLLSQLDAAKTKLDSLVGMTLSEKSKRRVAQIFGNLSDTRLLDEMFIKKGEYHTQFMSLIDDLEKLVDGDEP